MAAASNRYVDARRRHASSWRIDIDSVCEFLCACCVCAGISVLAYVTNSPMCRQALLLAKVCGSCVHGGGYA